MIMHSLLLEYK